MATTPNLRNDIASVRSTATNPTSPRNLVAKAARYLEQSAKQPTINTSQLATTDATRRPTSQVQQPPRKVILRLSYIRPERMEEYLNEDPVLRERGAAAVLGISESLLKKWRQRDKGPDYIQYGLDGPVLYPLSSLRAFMVAHLVVTSKKGGKRK